jgi:hypothetical protein
MHTRDKADNGSKSTERHRPASAPCDSGRSTAIGNIVCCVHCGAQQYRNRRLALAFRFLPRSRLSRSGHQICLLIGEDALKLEGISALLERKAVLWSTAAARKIVRRYVKRRRKSGGSF